MAYTFNPKTSRGKVRLLIHDHTTEVSPTQGTHYVFADDDIDGFLDINDTEVWGGAADACRALAANSIAGSLLIDLAGIKIDKKNTAKFWMDLAKQYEAKSTNEDVVEFIDSAAYEITEFGEDLSEKIGDV